MLNVRYIRNNFVINVGDTAIKLEPDQFHQLVYLALRAQEQEILGMMKLTEKTLEEVQDVTKLWNQ